eukprot:TRINITY_DN29_c0_g2_i7.p1 TRINITY_DN29_c0_g2~~TRINITY_DN29_c0_g2_i7.p1  ORF type:complete len:218 (+),score=-2.25 TRINITY_DN29_c0_g2_i7:414-1067(+)
MVYQNLCNKLNKGVQSICKFSDYSCLSIAKTQYQFNTIEIEHNVHHRNSYLNNNKTSKLGSNNENLSQQIHSPPSKQIVQKQVNPPRNTKQANAQPSKGSAACRSLSQRLISLTYTFIAREHTISVGPVYSPSPSFSYTFLAQISDWLGIISGLVPSGQSFSLPSFSTTAMTPLASPKSAAHGFGGSRIKLTTTTSRWYESELKTQLQKQNQARIYN